MAVIANVRKNDIKIKFASALSKIIIKFIGNHKGFISKGSILAVLPQPN